MLDIRLGKQETQAAIGETNQLTFDAVVESVDDILQFIEDAQVHKYTQNDFPPKPTGTPYVRTFDLFRSSRKQRTGALSGMWLATIDYAQYVLGMRSQQADVHKGRWLSTDEVEQMAVEASEEIILNNVRKRFTE